MAGLISEPLTAYDDKRLLEYGIGFTNIVGRTSRGSADLSRKEIKEGGVILKRKIMKWNPKIVVFNGKGKKHYSSGFCINVDFTKMIN